MTASDKRIAIFCLPFFLFYFFLTWFVAGNGFFWDTIQLSSMQASWFFDHSFLSIILPEAIDSGHPPGFGWYLAACWKIFGRSLPVSHFAMLPFLLGIVWEGAQSARHFLGSKAVFPFLLFLAADACLLGQSALVSPDIALIYFFLLGWNAVLTCKSSKLAIASVGMAMISMRGMMVVVFLYFFSLLDFFWKNGYLNFRTAGWKMVPFFPGGILALTFLIFHYYKTGWIGYHSGSPWASLFQPVDLIGFGRNLALAAWRWIDFGRIFLWGIIVGVFIKKGMVREQKGYRFLAVSVVLCFVVLGFTMLRYSGLLMHRYLLPCFILFDLMVVGVILQSPFSGGSRYFLIAIGVLGLACGNLWVYPKEISQGWDATLGHLPYYKLRRDMIEYIDKNKIPYYTIGSAFPNLRIFDDTDLNGRPEHFAEKDLNKNDYIFYSNIFNDFTDQEIGELENNWEVIQRYERYPVCVILYHKP